MRVWSVVPGPATSGVARHGLAVASALAGAGVDVAVARSPRARPDGRYDVTSVQFADALFGGDVASAADAFVDWSRTVPRPLVVTLHDVPGADPDPVRDARRLAAYRRVVAVCDGVVVCSEREGASLQCAGAAVAVVPLPVTPLARPGPRPAWGDLLSVGVLGFLYPGKGHAQVLDAVARLAQAGRPQVVALGAASPGSERLVDDLHRKAEGLGVPFVITGPLSDADLHAGALATAVPVAAYQTLGASASLMTWLACGRRPVVTSGPQAREAQARWPGSVLETPPGPAGLAACLSAALDDPSSTWRPGSLADSSVVEEHLAVFTSAGAR